MQHYHKLSTTKYKKQDEEQIHLENVMRPRITLSLAGARQSTGNSWFQSWH